MDCDEAVIAFRYANCVGLAVVNSVCGQTGRLLASMLTLETGFALKLF